MAQAEEFAKLKSLVSSEEIIEQGTPEYEDETSTWSSAKNQHPKLLIRPKSLEHLSKVIAFLNNSDLDFAVRSLGFGNASAKDVLVSLKAFDDFEWDAEKKVVTLGVGQTWVDFYRKMEKVTRDYAAVACRTPSIGVGGSVLNGGFSWLSSEYGCTSDPISMLDAQVVKLDGSVIWASEEPDLLWGLRGAGINFGVVTKFKLQAFRYPRNMWAGPILLPRKHLPQIAKGIGDMSDRKNKDPKVGLFVYLLKKELLGFEDAGDDMIVLHVFDALGEDHGRSEEAFAWALNLPGAIDHTEVKSLMGVSLMQEKIATIKGKMVSEWTAISLTDMPEEMVLKSFEWWDKMQEHPELRDGTYLLFEMFCTRDVIGNRSDSAWPRPKGIKHELLLGTGCHPGASPEARKLARQRLIDGPDEILGAHTHKNLLPNALESFHDPKQCYEEHYPKLMELKKKYDPKNKLKGPLNQSNAANGQAN